jgi:hypothetical protein
VPLGPAAVAWSWDGATPVGRGAAIEVEVEVEVAGRCAGLAAWGQLRLWGDSWTSSGEVVGGLDCMCVMGRVARCCCCGMRQWVNACAWGGGHSAASLLHVPTWCAPVPLPIMPSFAVECYSCCHGCWHTVGGSHVVWDPSAPTSSHLANWTPEADPATTQDGTPGSTCHTQQLLSQQRLGPSSCQPGVLWLPAQVEVEAGQLLVAKLVHNTIGWVGGWGGWVGWVGGWVGGWADGHSTMPSAKTLHL